MAYIDKVKEEIGWLKVVFAILLAADISLVAWGVQNYGKASPLLLTIWCNCIILGYIDDYLD